MTVKLANKQTNKQTNEETKEEHCAPEYYLILTCWSSFFGCYFSFFLTFCSFLWQPLSFPLLCGQQVATPAIHQSITVRKKEEKRVDNSGRMRWRKRKLGKEVWPNQYWKWNIMILHNIFAITLYYMLLYLVAKVTLSISLNVSPILSFVRPVTTIYESYSCKDEDEDVTI